VILQEEAEIGEDETAGELGERLSVEGADVLVRSVELALRGEAQASPQDATKATFAPLLKKSDGWVDWTLGCGAVKGRIMGTNPWPGATTIRGQEPLRLWRAKVSDETEETPPGTVLRVEPEGIVVGCRVGSVLVTELQVPGKRRMPADVFARGYRVETGEQWGGPDSPTEV
jgi:methionyl-tRNA formyltransferase